MPRFCMGAGVAMGTTGLKWPGGSADDDCALLWASPLGVTSVVRSAAACVCVFLLALLAQFLTTSSGARAQEAKERARRMLADAAARMEQGAGVYLYAATRQQKESKLRACSSPEGECHHAMEKKSGALVIGKVSNAEHLADSVLHGLRILVAYLLMLAAMTYDVALLASIVAGFSAGFYWFSNDTAKVPTSADPCCS